MTTDSICSVFDTDTEFGLKLLHYPDTMCLDEQSKKCRGTIYNDTGDIVLQSLHYTEEYDETEEKKLEEKFESVSDWSFFNSIEGTLLRVFCWKGKWFLSSHKKINAFNSKWSCSKTFGKLFNMALDLHFGVENSFSTVLTPKLEETEGYLFLLATNFENRIVCDSGDNKIYFIGTLLNRQTFVRNTLLDFMSPEKIEINSFTELLEYVRKIDTKKYQGIIAFSNTTNLQIKIMNSEYKRLTKIRGNESSLLKQYLKLRNNADSLITFKTLYPTFDSKLIEVKLFDLAYNMYSMYCARFIRKEYVVINSLQYPILKKIHELYMVERKPITLNDVVSVINSYSPSRLNHILNIV